MIDLNVNEYVQVKLNDIGIEELKRSHQEVRNFVPSLGDFEPPKTDEDGWSRWQLHDLMNRFGHMMSIGSQPPFEIGIRIEGPHKISETS